jgi:UDP-glucuronate decarboxylase
MTKFLLESDIDEIVTSLPTAYGAAFAGKRILITGGRGFLGRYFTEVFSALNQRLEAQSRSPCELIILDNLITAGEHGSQIPLTKHIAFVEHDIIKPFHPERPVDFIIHAAGIASPYYYRKYPLETLEVATTGLRNVLELARKYPGCKLTFFSSSEIYGDPDPKHVPIKESYRGNVSCLGARASYDESKRLGETLVRIYHEKYGVHGTIIRPFNIMGPGFQKTDYRVLPNFGARIFDNKPLQIYGSGNQTRTFCYITDAIRGFLQVLINGEPGEPYNIGNPEPEISMIDLVQMIGKIMNRDIQYDIIEYPDSYPADEPMRRCPDITKAVLHLGYKPSVNLYDGLTRFFTWAKEAYVNL